jgi:hypothetical protein
MSFSRSDSRLAFLVALVLLCATAASAQSFYSVSGTVSLNSANTKTLIIGPKSGALPGTGTSPVDFTVPQDFFDNAGSFAAYFPAYPSVAQWISTFSSSHAAAGLAAGAGPGSFAFCPPVGNPANPTCTNPAQATAGFNGLIQYTGGANQFGGTIQLVRHQAGSVSRRIATGPSQFSHTPRTRTSSFPPGAGMSFTTINVRAPGVITQSPVLGPSGQIQTPGFYVGPGPTPPTGFETGQPLTTGQVILRDSVPSAFSFTLTGYDNRTPAGVGTIQLVAGSYIQNPQGNPAQAFPRQMTMTLSMPEPTGYVGLAAGALAIVLVARGRRRGI